MMKRYWLFGGSDYYAQGGFNDFLGSFDSLQGSLDDAARREKLPYYDGEIEWWHIFDSVDQKIVAKTDGQAHGAGDELPKLD